MPRRSGKLAGCRELGFIFFAPGICPASRPGIDDDHEHVILFIEDLLEIIVLAWPQIEYNAYILLLRIRCHAYG